MDKRSLLRRGPRYWRAMRRDSFRFQVWRLFPALLISALCFRAASVAQPLPPKDRGGIVAKLKDVKARIEAEERTVKKLREEQAQVQKELDRISAELAQVSAERKEAETHLEEKRAKSRVLELTIERLETDIASSRTQLEQRIVGVYKMYRRTIGLDYLFNASSVTDLLKRARYLSDVARGDRDRLERLRTLIQDIEAEQAELQKTLAQEEEYLQRVTALEKEIETKQASRVALLEKAKKEQEQEEHTLRQLKGMATELEAILAGVMGGKPTSTQSGPPPAEDSSPDHREFPGKGLASLKGKLSLPVEGRIVQHFGSRYHDEFSDVLFSKGIEITGRGGGRVKAIAPGRIVFSSTLPGYGNVVIIDHGQRYYSLYGRLAEIMCKLGDIVQAGEDLARIGEPDRKGRNFYFELRHHGRAIDPAAFLRK